jgi:hypothetical protein
VSRVVLSSKTADETKKILFDFGSSLPVGVTLSSAVTTCSVYRGVDDSPSSVISGPASVSGSVASQPVTAGIFGLIYNLKCLGTLSDGQVVELSGLLAITDSQT